MMHVHSTSYMLNHRETENEGFSSQIENIYIDGIMNTEMLLRWYKHVTQYMLRMLLHGAHGCSIHLQFKHFIIIITRKGISLGS